MSNRFFAAALGVVLGLVVSTTAWAQSYQGGPIQFGIRTPSGHIQRTVITWTGDRRELVVTQLSDHVPAENVQEYFYISRILTLRSTTIDMQPAGVHRASYGACCGALRGEGTGYFGNRRYSMKVEQAMEGDRLRQTVTIRGYNGRVVSDYDIRLLFQ
ncbi:MAG: hypothetical protein IPK81_02110 [Rhodospirillales bacterium]|nr:MAG: hypothetical protein IPK81_02110 [Rhodospirillales bacterium]